MVAMGEDSEDGEFAALSRRRARSPHIVRFAEVRVDIDDLDALDQFGDRTARRRPERNAAIRAAAIIAPVSPKGKCRLDRWQDGETAYL